MKFVPPDVLFDPAWLVFVAPPLLFCAGAGIWAHLTLDRYRHTKSRIGQTGAEIAREALRRAGIDDVRVVARSGLLRNFYDHLRKTLYLTPEVYNGLSVSAVGLAAHEVAHAVEHAQGYGPLALRQWAAPFFGLLANAGPWMLVLGLVMPSPELVIASLWIFNVSATFAAACVPLEIGALRKARGILPELAVTSDAEAAGLRRVGWAATLRFVAWTLLTLVGAAFEARRRLSAETPDALDD